MTDFLQRISQINAMLYVVLFVKHLDKQQWLIAILCFVIALFFQWMAEDEETVAK